MIPELDEIHPSLFFGLYGHAMKMHSCMELLETGRVLSCLSEKLFVISDKKNTMKTISYFSNRFFMPAWNLPF
jgi:hypothetical protein